MPVIVQVDGFLWLGWFGGSFLYILVYVLLYVLVYMVRVNTGESSLAAGFSGRWNVYFGGDWVCIYLFCRIPVYSVLGVR